MTELLAKMDDVISKQKQALEYAFVNDFVCQCDYCCTHACCVWLRAVERGHENIAKQQHALKALAMQEQQMRKQIAVSQESLTRLTKQMVRVYDTAQTPT